MIKLNYVGFFNHSGYGQAAQDYINALLLLDDIDLRIEIIGNQINQPSISDERFALLRKLSQKEKTDEHINVYHCVPVLQTKFSKAKRTIGFATFETFDPPSNGSLNWINALNKNDAVIVPSEFNYHVFAHTKLSKPLFYIPHCLDMDQYNPSVEPMKKYDKFTFLFFGTWKRRKGYPQLLEAWFSEFDQNDNVQLVIKTDHGVQGKNVVQQVEQIKNKLGYRKKETAPIVFENKIFSEHELPSFLKSVDCLVAAHLGEGFGLPGAQCLALEVPIIITDFSGSKDYANKDTARLIKPRGYMMYEYLDRYPQYKARKWPFVSVADIKDAMRDVINNYSIATQKAKTGSEQVREKFNYAKIGEMFRDMLKTVYNA
jgi:glycosyltransferase involved in cell wall biosynthesis